MSVFGCSFFLLQIVPKIIIDSMDNRIEALYNNNFGTIDY